MSFGVRIRKMHPGLPLIIVGSILLVTGGILVAIGQAQWSRAPSSVLPTVVPAGEGVPDINLGNYPLKVGKNKQAGDQIQKTSSPFAIGFLFF